MRGPRRPAETSIAIFLLGLLAFSPPILWVFGARVFVFELPLLFLYLFGVWGLIVGLVAWTADFGDRGATGQPPTRRQNRSGAD